MKRSFIYSIVTTVAFCLLPNAATAQIDWSNTTNNNAWFDLGTNWSGGIAPGADDTARFNQSSSYEAWFDSVTAQAIPDVNRLEVTTGEVKLINKETGTQLWLEAQSTLVSGANTSLENIGLSLDVGACTIENGGTISASGSGYFRGSSLTTVKDGNLVLENVNFSFNFLDVATTTNSVGSVLISGPEINSSVSNNINIGFLGHGSLIIKDGAAPFNDTQYNLYLGEQANSVGRCDVDTGALVKRNLVMVGRLGQGTLNVSNSGSLYTNLVWQGLNVLEHSQPERSEINISSGGLIDIGGDFRQHNGGIVSIDGAQSEMSVGIDYTIDKNPQPNDLLIRNGGQLNCGRDFINQGDSSSINWDVVGVGSQASFGRALRCLYDSQVNLRVLEGGTVQFNSIVSLQGQILVDGIGSQFLVTNEFSNPLMDGDVQVTNDGEIIAGSILNSSTIANANGWLSVETDFTNQTTGTLSGHGQFAASLGWQNFGTILFGGGNSIVLGNLNNGARGIIFFAHDGQVEFNNDVAMVDGAGTTIEIAGTEPGQFGQMIVGGNFTVGNVLSVDLVNGFELEHDQFFLIGDITGAQIGEFFERPEGSVVGNYNGIDLRITYVAGDGNDIALFTDPAPISPTLPMGRKFLDGFGVSGNLGSIHASNDQYWEIAPSPTSNPAKQKVDLMLLGTSPTISPTTFSFRLEARMTGGDPGPVIQRVYFITPANNRKVLIDSRPVTNGDVSAIITPTGDLSRFVNPLNGDVIVKVTYITDPAGPLYEWNVEIDEAVWLIE